MKKPRNLIAFAMLGFALSNSASLDFINKNNPDRLQITKDWDYEFVFGFESASDSDYKVIRNISGRVK